MQCELLSLNRSGLYYVAHGDSERDLLIKRRIDEVYTACPFYGIRKITAQLRADGLLKGANVQISMDGKGRALDNIFTERLWRTVKYEEVYLKDYASPREARTGIGEYLGFYNTQRLHQALGYQTPESVYFTKGDSSTDKKPVFLS